MYRIPTLLSSTPGIIVATSAKEIKPNITDSLLEVDGPNKNPSLSSQYPIIVGKSRMF